MPIELFAGLRDTSVARLVELREAIDESYIALSEQEAKERFELLFDRTTNFLNDNDTDRQRRFVRHWLALRLGEGRSPESVMHALVATGDILVQVVRLELPPGAEALELVHALQHSTYVTARSVVVVLADDLNRKSNQPDERIGNHEGGESQ